MDGSPFVILFSDGVPCQTDTEGARMFILPILIGHLMPIRAEPRYVLDFGPTNPSPLEKLTSMQDGLLTPQLNQPLHEA